MVLTVIIAALGGFIAGVFVYRNNAKDIGKIADKVDDVYDRVEKLIEDAKK